MPMPPRRLFLVFFGDAATPVWWSRLFRRGFRHVSAAAWYADQERWVYVNPTRRGTVVEVWRSDEFDGRLAQLAEASTAALRFGQQYGRGMTPWAFHCVGAVKAILGVRCLALSPYGLYRALLARGAEPACVGLIAERSAPCRHDAAIQQPEDAGGRARGSGDCGRASG